MEKAYYIEAGGAKDGPLELVTLMRRIRMQKVTPDTPIYMDDAQAPALARDIPELAMFFDQRDVGRAAIKPPPTLNALIYSGWRFTMNHSAMTAFAGGILLLSILFAVGLINALGLPVGVLITWVIFVTLHNIYLICALRLYRRQPFSAEFLDKELSAILPPLALASLTLALMMAGGAVLLIVPCVIVSTLYVFAPFFILDRRFNVVEAMQASRTLLQKNHRRYIGIVSLLVTAHLGCLLLIIPTPLTLPIFAAALAELYEELSAS